MTSSEQRRPPQFKQKEFVTEKVGPVSLALSCLPAIGEEDLGSSNEGGSNNATVKILPSASGGNIKTYISVYNGESIR
jgi:hypothetical protein